ncbi:hypothetical protein C8Q73DRAFT_327346 [Cubamyces lactineus]|nr:hypothetical protein C8Q73DRAFT_327346 [Cubamyces lactineus]
MRLSPARPLLFCTSRFSNLPFKLNPPVDALGFARMGLPLEPDRPACVSGYHTTCCYSGVRAHAQPQGLSNFALDLPDLPSPRKQAGRQTRSLARSSLSSSGKFQILATCRWGTRARSRRPPAFQRTFSRPLAFPSRTLRVSDRVLPSYRLPLRCLESLASWRATADSNARASTPRLSILDHNAGARDGASCEERPPRVRDTRRHAKCARGQKAPARGGARGAHRRAHGDPRATVLPKPTQRARCVQIGTSGCQYRKGAIAHSNKAEQSSCSCSWRRS